MFFTILFALLFHSIHSSSPYIYGSTTTATCPVTLQSINITKTTPYVTFIKSNQKLYFSSNEAATKYQNRPRQYWLSPFELPPPGKDGKRGLPDLHKQNVSCAVDGTDFLVNTMDSSRVMHLGGQCLYFCCGNCRTSFWREPGKYIKDAGAEASSLIGGSTGNGEGFGGQFVFIAIVMTSLVTVVAVLAVSKLYSNTTAMSTSFDRLHRRTNDAKEEITLPSYSDDVRIDLETDEI